MLSELKLLHLYLGQLIQDADAKKLTLSDLDLNRSETCVFLRVEFERNATPPSCDHLFRRIGSGEYECTRPGCGIITDDLESEQWQ